MTRGQIQFLLANPIYVGQIRHKTQVHPGQHEPIIQQGLWDRVQARLQAASRKGRGQRAAKSDARLKGKLYDEAGDRLTPTHTQRGNKRLSYYVSSALVRAKTPQTGSGWRLPARSLETQVAEAVKDHLQQAGTHLLASAEVDAHLAIEQKLKATLGSASMAELMDVVGRVVVTKDALSIALDQERLAQWLETVVDELNTDQLRFTHGVRLRRRGVELKLVPRKAASPELDHSLIKAIALSHKWADEVRAGASLADLRQRHGVPESTLRHRIGLASLSPRIVETILAGRQPPELTLRKLVTMRLPLDWSEQESALGFAAS